MRGWDLLKEMNTLELPLGLLFAGVLCTHVCTFKLNAVVYKFHCAALKLLNKAVFGQYVPCSVLSVNFQNLENQGNLGQ